MPPTYRCRGCGADLGLMPRTFCHDCADTRPNDDLELSDNPEENR